ncbi:MAG: hypothetical protein ACK2UW_11060, partial [Anaerolineales bacterium]
MQPTAESGQPLSRSRIVISRFLIGITVIALLLITWKTAAALQLDLNEGPDAAQGSSTSSPEIRLSAASGTTTTFKATNNR